MIGFFFCFLVLSQDTVPAEIFLDAALKTFHNPELQSILANDFVAKPGFIPAGGDIGRASEMTIAQAKRTCETMTKCVGITYPNGSANPEGKVLVNFKDKTDVSFNENWHSWIKPKSEEIRNPLHYSAAVLYLLRNLRLAFRAVDMNNDLDHYITSLETRVSRETTRWKEKRDSLPKIQTAWKFVPRIITQSEDLQAKVREGVLTVPLDIIDGVGISFVEEKPVEKNIPLSDGNSMPRIGFGTWMLRGQECYQAVKWALEAGYRHIDTAEGYGNEADVGRAIRDSDVPREEIFVVSKISRDANFGAGKTRKLVLKTLDKMGLDYFDMYKIHGPIGDRERLKQAWKDLEGLKDEGKIKSLGVSNYDWFDLRQLEGYAKHFPVYLQNKYDVYTHGMQSQDENSIYQFALSKNMVMMGYSAGNAWPGKISARDDAHIQQIAKEVKKTPTQVINRWALQIGINLIPRSSKKERIIENFGVWDFELSQNQLQRMNGIMRMSAYVQPRYIHDTYKVLQQNLGTRDEL